MSAKQGIRSAYVTHYVRGINRTAELLRRIYATYGRSAELCHAQFYLRPAGTITERLRESSRRGRSFLFVSLALVTAASLGADEVCVCENGPLALNLPLTAAMVPTRHAHSQFLKAMERFARQLFGTSIRIWNPFELRTKGQLTRTFAPHPDLALETVSCWNQQWAGRGRNYGRGHCGFCLPCLVRLVSLEAAGIRFPKGHFDYDVRHHARLRMLTANDIPRLGPFHALVQFCRTVKECRTWQEFVRTFPLVVDSEPTSATTDRDWFAQIFRTMKRFAVEVSRSLDKD